ncbi:hypothetical protein CMI37_27915 [Candidatus Pacearchaeota archaeon]|nr:hypothetical protein [Candidatus Pacearchaeota archaeon]|tara:strand:- start:443 stop:658 length:216 start_codon:yes stop_codon:yes gene_type:complete
MEKIKELRAKIGAFASALEKMNAEATPETALTVEVANDVFGKMLAEMQEELAVLEATFPENPFTNLSIRKS